MANSHLPLSTYPTMTTTTTNTNLLATNSTKSPKHTPSSILANFYAAERSYMLTPTPTTLASFTSTISPSITLHIQPNLPWSGTYTGLDGFKAWSSKMATYFDVVDVQDAQVFTDGTGTSDKILVHSSLRFRVRKNQRELRYPFCQVVVVDVEGGVVQEIRPFHWDVRGLAEALEEVVE